MKFTCSPLRLLAVCLISLALLATVIFPFSHVSQAVHAQQPMNMLAGAREPHIAATRKEYATATKATGTLPAANTIPAGATPANLVQYEGGPVMQSPVVSYAVFWEPPTLQDGTATYVSPNYNSLIEQYLTDVNGSGLYNNNTQYYDTSGHITDNSTFGGAWVDTSPYPASGCTDTATPNDCLNDQQIKAEVAKAISVNGWSAGLNHVFFFFSSEGEGSCHGDCAFTNFCAYHWYFNDKDNGQTVLYGNLPYPGTDLSACGVQTSPNNDFSVDSTIDWLSHEEMETITDPLGTAWLDAYGGEIGDKCGYKFGAVALDGGLANEEWNSHYYIVQMEWSNATGGCVQTRAMSGSLYAGDNSTLYALNAPDGSLNWQPSIPGVTLSPPTVASGVVYAGSSDDKLYAFNATNGSLLWQASLGGSLSYAPAIAGGVAYLGASDNNLYAINTGNGSQVWKVAAGGTVTSAPVVGGGFLLAGINGNTLAAFNITSGATGWSFQEGSAISSPLSVAGSILYAGYSDGNLYAFNAKNGKQKWHYTTGGAISSQPYINASKVYVGAEDNYLYAINTTYGTLGWRASTGSGVVQNPPTIYNKTLYSGASDGSVYAFSLSGGVAQWHYSTGAAITGSLQFFNGVIYASSQDATVYALNFKTGALLWRVQTGGPMNSAPVLADGIVYAASSDAHVYALWADDGSQLWSYATGSAVTLSPVVILTSY